LLFKTGGALPCERALAFTGWNDYGRK